VRHDTRQKTLRKDKKHDTMAGGATREGEWLERQENRSLVGADGQGERVGARGNERMRVLARGNGDNCSLAS
jgi:hypothetical protein